MIIGSHHKVGKLDSKPESNSYIIQVGDMMIKRVTKVKYLGLVVDEICPGMNMLNIYKKKSVVTLEL